MEFHVSRQARDLYQFDQALFALNGNVIFTNFHGARLFAQKINQKRDLVAFPEKAVRASAINAMGLIDEILHYIIAQYRQQVNPPVWDKAINWLDTQFGSEIIDQALRRFADDFPPLAVYRRELSIDIYLKSQTDGVSNRQILLEELLMLWLTNTNPAMTAYGELFDDTSLRKETKYLPMISSLRSFFETQPYFGPDQQNLIDMLRKPVIASPYSLFAQLEFIRQRWAILLGGFLYRLLGSLDLFKEEEIRFGLGPGPALIPSYRKGQMEAEPERYSLDREWMPHLVLIAKNSYVWLDQLTKKYQRPIHRLDEIPDEEFDLLARRGFTGLWLIGLWERSQASQLIKQLCGNPEAVASAYSLASYDIAGDLGGESAYTNLRDRAWQHGIRLASDMVPNHMGIDSSWVIEHPDWFVSLDYSPFPSYTFEGPDLSKDSRVGIFIEDHYYSRSDAAVVFRRLDRWTGDTQFIYHGNDGTSMPWNDTAQLNYLNPEVREAVIQTILGVARKFPIIRFDAAMTLAKKHYERLWFPEPGKGGAIPSRIDHGMTKDQFEAAFPVEFWREVVDRVAKEVPDTLLLAEAFWLMEGYFVRTLGMHRVYNSAFMNMLRNEDNANYRLVMKNTLEFDPEILKRFVNFMNNPDERTAVDQFGKGDKYFGICTLMATLPGLPMFGHGQIEGYSEKYGMEFRRAYWDENLDEYLVSRHEREIFPLLHKRYLFADVTNFLLYDFFTSEGAVNEDVFAYSNGVDQERALVIYNNRFNSTRGWIRASVSFMEKHAQEDGRRLIQRSLAEGLGLQPSSNMFCIFRDHLAGLEYIRSSKDIAENGLYFELDAYKAMALLDIRETADDEWRQYSQLNAYLNGRGVPSINDALRELFLAPVHTPLHELINPDMYKRLLDARQTTPNQASPADFLDEIDYKMTNLLRGIKHLVGASCDENSIARGIEQQVHFVLKLPVMEFYYPLPASVKYIRALDYLKQNLENDPSRWATLFSWLFVHDLGKVSSPIHFEEQTRSWLDEWMLGRIITQTVQDLGVEQSASWRGVTIIKLLTSHQRWFDQLGLKPAYQILETWLQDSAIQNFLAINRYQGVLWFNKESFEDLIWWMMLVALLNISSDPDISASEVVEKTIGCYDLILELIKALESSDYQLEKLLDALK